MTLQHSDGNVTTAFSPSIKGIWLINETTGERIVVFGEVEQGIDEDGEIKAVLGRRDPVYVFTRIGGYVGSIEGILRDYEGITHETYRQRLESIKGKGHRHTLRLIYKFFNFRVVIGEVSCTARADHPAIYDVSINFWQTGDFFEAYL